MSLTPEPPEQGSGDPGALRHDWPRIKKLFSAGASIAPTEREALLRESGEEAEIQDEVRLLWENNDMLRTSTSLQDPTPFLASPRRHFAENQVIAGRYRVVRYIASGGMGEVYEAEDLHREAVVAVKAIRPSVLAGSDLLQRFKREIDMALRVTHPNVGRIYDFNRHTGDDGETIAFLTMEYLPGETLARRIQRCGCLPTDEALAILRDIASGLDAIHECGIVHRDFKSANIMLIEQVRGDRSGTASSSGARMGLRAKVMDFGLARTLAGDATITQTGLIGGTPPYMAPEQFEGIATPASDIYALGVVMHEMVTGNRPHAGGSSSGSASGTPAGAGPPKSAPQPWRGVIERCLATDPQDRFPSALDVVAALSPAASKTGTSPKTWMFVSLGVAALALAVGAGWLIGPIFHPTPKHLAVLQIRSESADAADQAFCAGLSDTVREDVAELESANRTLWVLPSSAVRELRSASDAAKETGANLVLEPTFYRTSNGFRLNAELVDPKENRVLRSAHVEASDSTRLRESADGLIASLLDLKVPQSVSEDIARSESREPGAFDYYAQANGYLQREGQENTNRAINLFTKAIAIDSNYAVAYAGRGEAYAKLYEVTKATKWIQLASDDASKALKLNGNLAVVHSIVGQIDRLTGKTTEAVGELNRAVAIDPGCFPCYFNLGAAYEDAGKLEDARRTFASLIDKQPANWMGYGGLARVEGLLGHPAESAKLLKHIVELTPDSAELLTNLGAAYDEMGRHGEAIPYYKRAIAIRPTALAYENLGAALMYLHRNEEAVAAMRKGVELAPDDHDNWRNLGDSYRQVPGKEAEAEDAYRHALTLAEEHTKIRPNDPDLISSIALYDAHLGEKSEAVAMAHKALDMSSVTPDEVFTAGLALEIAGNRTEALQVIDRAWKAGYPLSLIDGEPELADFKKDVAYQKWIQNAQSKNKQNK